MNGLDTTFNLSQGFLGYPFIVRTEAIAEYVDQDTEVVVNVPPLSLASLSSPVTVEGSIDSHPDVGPVPTTTGPLNVPGKIFDLLCFLFVPQGRGNRKTECNHGR